MKFPQLVQIAADSVSITQGTLPSEIRDIAYAVPMHYEAAPDASVLAEGFESDILGLFTGSAYGTEFSADIRMPPQILLYINSLWDYADRDVTRFRAEVRLTYLHELGHYFGWNEDEVAARGLD